MKIVYCTKNITNKGGIERILANKTANLVAKGFDVSIVSIERADVPPFFKFDPRVKFYSLGCNHFYEKHGLKRNMNFGKNRKVFLEKMAILLHELKPDITISLFDKYSRYIYEIKDGSKKIIELQFAKHKRAQYMAKLEKWKAGRCFTHFYRRKEYNIIKHYDKFVVLTEEDKEAWGELGNMIVIPNGLAFMPQRKSDVTSKRIIALGRISKQKQHDVLIKIWNKIAHKYPDWKLSIYGSGDSGKLESLVAELNLQKSVEIFPATKDVEKELLDSSIMAFSSKYEGFGMVLIEAMSYGVPVVSYACQCGPRDIIKDGVDGFLIPSGEMNLFADKLSVLIEDESLRKTMGKAAAENVVRFSQDLIIEKWMGLFHSLVNEKETV